MRTRKTVIILVSGKAGAGKTTVKDLLYSKLLFLGNNLECMKYSFADPLKFIAQAFIGWNKEKDEKGRKLLQSLGKVGREYDIDIWCKHLLNQLDKNPSPFPPSFILIDDWRFRNELDFFQDNPMFDVVSIRVFGRGGLEGDNGNDVSETELTEAKEENLNYVPVKHTWWYNFTIENSGNLSQLETKIDTVLSEIRKQYIIEGETNATT